MNSRWEHSDRSSATSLVAFGYALLAMLATALCLLFSDEMPWTHPKPWTHMTVAEGMACSALVGLALALAIIAMTRVAVGRFHWAQRLHRDLRPIARDLSPGQILLLAGLSSLGEELLFRGFFTPLLGVVLSALLFGMAHQIRGPSRWVWAAWATGVGIVFGILFAFTGSLVGPLLSHAVINAVNLTFLRNHDPESSEHHPA